jgi:tetratricopeptide (TPR) repeat protein
LLEAAVKLDGSYAPAWDALGRRYYYDAAYSDGGDAAYQHSSTALERALQLDPNLVTAAATLTENRVQWGQLDKAADAEALVKRRPDSAEAHLTVAYVYRYAGLLEASAQECDAALALDRGAYNLRSCAFAFLELGKTAQARQYLSSGPGIGMGEPDHSGYFAPRKPTGRRQASRAADVQGSSVVRRHTATMPESSR